MLRVTTLARATEVFNWRQWSRDPAQLLLPLPDALPGVGRRRCKVSIEH